MHFMDNIIDIHNLFILKKIIDSYGGKIALVGLKPRVSTSEIFRDIQNH